MTIINKDTYPLKRCDYKVMNPFIADHKNKLYNDFLDNYINKIDKTLRKLSDNKYNFTYTKNYYGVPYSILVEYNAFIEDDINKVIHGKQLLVLNYDFYSNYKDVTLYMAHINKANRYAKTHFNIPDELEIDTEPLNEEKAKEFIKTITTTVVKNEYNPDNY